MALRYQFLLARRTDQPCPDPRLFKPGTRRAFRFTHNLATEDDFLPIAIIDTPIKPRGNCKRFGLSFWRTLEDAKKKYQIAVDRVDAPVRFGDHIGEIDLCEEDGVMCEPASDGHITLHPDEQAIFAARIRGYHAP